MHRFAPVALATVLAATVPALLCAQAPTPFTVPAATGHFTDPANLAGERVRPRDGRELPIDGGLSANGQPDNALGLAQLLRKLNTRASLMLIVAHPDDEDGGMLTYYSRGLGARVAVLTLTRGEGGQNEMTGDFEDALGLIRTQELLAADRYMGVDTQMFGTEVDFGFSKTKSESFQKWNHERVLYDAVRAIRIFRPLVIAAVFSGAVTDGHGQHQVSGQIAQEVFKAAGDPNVFPELTREGILPWQPLKVYARVPFSRVTAQGLFDYATGQTVPAEFTNYVTGQKFTTEPTPDITIHEGDTDPLITTCSANPADLPKSLSSRPQNSSGHPERSAEREGEGPLYSAQSATDCSPLSYVQFARIGLGLQRTQIGAGMRVPSAGRFDVGYHLYGSRVCAPNLPNPTPNLCTSHSPESAKAPKARSIPAQGNALGSAPNNEPSAEGAPYNPALANQNPVILSEGSRPRAAAEGPRGFSSSEYSSTVFNQGLSHTPSFFDGTDTSLDGILPLDKDAPLSVAAWAHFTQSIAEAQQRFDPRHPDAIAPPLADALANVDLEIGLLRKNEQPSSDRANILHELRIKRVQLNDALALALGLTIDASAPTSNAIAASEVPVHITVSTSTDQPITYFDAELESRTGALTLLPYSHGSPAITKATPWTESVTATSQLTKGETRPYFFRTDIEQPVYKLAVPTLSSAASTPPALVEWVTLTFQGAYLKIGRVVHSGNQPVQIIPPVSLTLDRNAQVLPDGTDSLNIDIHTETQDHPQGDLRLHAPQDWTIRSPQRTLRAGTETFAASLSTHPKTATLKAEATISGTTYTEGFRPVGYGTLPRTNFYTPATLRVVPVDLKLPPENKRRIAYLPGTGDDVPAALASIGLAPTILKVSDLTPANLASFDTVILGVRTYNAHPDLHGAPTQALFDFARNGGNVVVQYQTNEFSAADAPYPLTLHGERVIDETAPVVLLTTANSKLKTDSQTKFADALLTTPNKITSADFNNWIEERGHGFLDTWDPHYTALTETHDPGSPSEHIADQAPQRGGLITTQLGKGRWTYCAFALYRQLPEAVPGAFRLFVNLLNP